MASRAVTKVKVDWSKLASKIDQSELPKLNKLKSRLDGNITRVSSLPDTLPKIDWAHYKANVSNPKLVEEIEKRYNNLKFESPKALPARQDELKKAQQQDEMRFEKFKLIAQSFANASAEVKQKFSDMIPVPDMNEEDWALTFPEWSLNADNPSLAPHLGRTPGLSREEAIAFEQPDPLPYATKAAWTDWEKRKKKFYSN